VLTALLPAALLPVFNLNTSGYIAGPNRVLPPASQTVSLAC